MTFGETLSNIRKQSNITQDELATYLKVSRSTIAGYETRNREPEYYVLVKIADYFNVSTDYLLGHERTDTPNTFSTISTPNDASGVSQSVLPEAHTQLKQLLSDASSLTDRDLKLLLQLTKAMLEN